MHFACEHVNVGGGEGRAGDRISAPNICFPSNFLIET